MRAKQENMYFKFAFVSIDSANMYKLRFLNKENGIRSPKFLVLLFTFSPVVSSKLALNICQHLIFQLGIGLPQFVIRTNIHTLCCISLGRCCLEL